MLKKPFTTAPVLTHWVTNAQIILETNAIDYALTAILSITSLDNSKATQLLFTPRLLLPQSSTTMYMTRSYSQSLKPSKYGDITFKVQLLQLMLSLTTKISNISRPQNSSLDDKSIGLNICHNSTLSSVSSPADLDPNPTL